MSIVVSKQYTLFYLHNREKYLLLSIYFVTYSILQYFTVVYSVVLYRTYFYSILQICVGHCRLQTNTV